MRILVDECLGHAVASWLSSVGHDVYSVSLQSPGAPDEELLARAYQEKRILMTGDKDFGEMIFREKQLHCGVALFRLADERKAAKIAAVQKLMQTHSGRLENAFVVVSESRVRFASDGH